jgi:hypothetical protein
MLHASYEIWGVTVVALLIGGWTLRSFFFRKRIDPVSLTDDSMTNHRPQDHDIQHRALVYLMTQKTDSVLAALARTIEQERQKLGVAVRNPSITEAVDAFEKAAIPGPDHRQPPYDQVLPMVHSGIAVAKIACQLQLPEAEVALVMRLNAV